MENVIHEFKIIETDDGFRIEIKGDKEVIRQMLKDFGPHWFFRAGGPFGKARGPFGRGFRFDFGPGFWGGFGGWCHAWWETEEEEKEKKPT